MYICDAADHDVATLLDIWLRAVRATHAFLSEDDIQSLLPLVHEYLRSSVCSLWVLALDDGRPIGFMGLTGDEIDALFIAPEHHRQGGGRLLVRQAEKQVGGLLRVSVNEQNPGATKFYESCGFRVVGRSETDGQGRPFPLLHMVQDGSDT